MGEGAHDALAAETDRTEFLAGRVLDLEQAFALPFAHDTGEVKLVRRQRTVPGQAA